MKKSFVYLSADKKQHNTRKDGGVIGERSSTRC